MWPVLMPDVIGNRETPPAEPAAVGSVPSQSVFSLPQKVTCVTFTTAPGLYVSWIRIAVGTTDESYSSSSHSFDSSGVDDAQADVISPEPEVFGAPLTWFTPQLVFGFRIL